MTSMYIMRDDDRTAVPMYIGACFTAAGTICRLQAYHDEFPPHIISTNHPIFQLEVVNALATLQKCMPKFKGQLIHIFMDNVMGAILFQLGKGRDTYIQACAHQLWLIEAILGCHMSLMGC